MRKCYLCLIFVLCCVASAPAQSEPIVSWDLGIFAAGVSPSTGQPVVPITNYTLTQVVCGIARVPVPTTTEQNPDEVRFDDPANPTNFQCVIQNLGPLFNTVPLGTGYRTAIRTRGATSVAAWSVLSNPFDRVGSGPVQPATGVLVRKHP